MNGRALVLGLGNPLRGDDGVGPAVIAALQAWPLPPDFDLVDGGTPGLETVLLWQGYERVLIVDAAQMGLAPGAWRRFTLQEAQLQRAHNGLRGTLHAAGLAEAVALAAALEALPPSLIIYGVQPLATEWGMGLSAAVATAVPQICQALAAELQEPPAGAGAAEAQDEFQTAETAA